MRLKTPRSSGQKPVLLRDHRYRLRRSLSPRHGPRAANSRAAGSFIDPQRSCCSTVALRVQVATAMILSGSVCFAIGRFFVASRRVNSDGCPCNRAKCCDTGADADQRSWPAVSQVRSAVRRHRVRRPHRQRPSRHLVFLSRAEGPARPHPARAGRRGSGQKISHFVKEIEGQMGWTTQLAWSDGDIEQRRLEALRLLRQVPAITELSLLDAVRSRAAQDFAPGDGRGRQQHRSLEGAGFCRGHGAARSTTVRSISVTSPNPT